MAAIDTTVKIGEKWICRGNGFPKGSIVIIRSIGEASWYKGSRGKATMPAVWFTWTEPPMREVCLHRYDFTRSFERSNNQESDGSEIFEA